MRKFAVLVLVGCIAPLLTVSPARASVTVVSDDSSRGSSEILFNYQGKVYTAAALRRVKTSNHCVPGLQPNRFDCYVTRREARMVHRERTRAARAASAAMPVPPDFTLINNDSGPYATLMLPAYEMRRLSDWGWNNRADVVKNMQELQWQMYKQQEFMDHMRNINKGTYDVANNVLSSLRS